MSSSKHLPNGCNQGTWRECSPPPLKKKMTATFAVHLQLRIFWIQALLLLLSNPHNHSGVSWAGRISVSRPLLATDRHIKMQKKKNKDVSNLIVVFGHSVGLETAIFHNVFNRNIHSGHFGVNCGFRYLLTSYQDTCSMHWCWRGNRVRRRLWVRSPGVKAALPPGQSVLLEMQHHCSPPPVQLAPFAKTED